MKWLINILFFLIGLHAVAIAQDDDIVEKKNQDTIRTFYFYDSAFLLSRPLAKAVDTSIRNFQHYHALIKVIPFAATQGNIGQVYYPLVWEEPTIGKQNQIGIGYHAYRITPQNLRYYITNVPFTELFFVTGRFKEQVFNGQHYQQVRRNLGIGVSFKITSNPGGYNRQKVDNTSAAIQLFFNTNNHRYGIAANYISNSFIHRENGGIATPLAFEENLETERKRILVKLVNAENRVREGNIYFHQYFKPGKGKLQDSATIGRKPLISGMISHIFNYQRLSQVYDDKNPVSNFYPRILLDSLKTYDSLILKTFDNKLHYQFSTFGTKNAQLKSSLTINHLYTIYKTGASSYQYSQLKPRFSGELALGKQVSINLTGESIFGNLNQGDYEWTAEGSYRVSSKNPIFIKGLIKNSLTSPGLFYNHYRSNHFGWENDFDPQKTFQQKLSFEAAGLKAALSHTSVQGYIYLDTKGLPAAYEPSFSVFSASIRSEIQVKKFRFDNILVLQKASDNSVLHLPALCINSSFSVEHNLFKGALQTISGVELYYNTSWQAPAYMPALRNYYLQTNQFTGNYLFADVFVNLRIKRARLFLLLQHANEGLFGYSYYMIPGYPMPDRAFKFGVNWLFFD